MSRSISDRLQDILQSADLAKSHIGDLDAIELAETSKARDAALFRLAVVCEAATRLPAEVQALAPEIPWRKIRAMRTYIVHGYWQIDLAVVVETIERDLPSLQATVILLIAMIERADV
jgi:uncharacterized protein with HEPN domain